MNKQMKLVLILFVSALCLGFSSCNDDDDPIDLSKEIVGTYIGTISIPLMEMEIEDAVIEIKRAGDNKVTLSMDQDLGIGKNIKVDVDSDVTIHSDYTYAVSGSTMFDLSDIDSPLPLPSSVPVKVEGTIDTSGKADIDISLTGLINATFDGEKQ